MTEKLEQNLKRLRACRAELDGGYGGVTRALGDVAGAADDEIPNLHDPLWNSKRDANNEANDVAKTMKSYTGSCLDGIVGGAKSAMNKTFDSLMKFVNFGEGPMGKALKGLMDGISRLLGLHKKLGIGALLKMIDELLNCLSDVDCVEDNIDKIERAQAEVNAFVRDYGLSDTGEFDMKGFLSESIEEFPLGPGKIEELKDAASVLTDGAADMNKIMQDNLKFGLDSASYSKEMATPRMPREFF
jgi:hypothetical protein